MISKDTPSPVFVLPDYLVFVNVFNQFPEGYYILYDTVCRHSTHRDLNKACMRVSFINAFSSPPNTLVVKVRDDIKFLNHLLGIRISRHAASPHRMHFKLTSAVFTAVNEDRYIFSWKTIGKYILHLCPRFWLLLYPNTPQPVEICYQSNIQGI